MTKNLIEGDLAVDAGDAGEIGGTADELEDKLSDADCIKPGSITEKICRPSARTFTVG